MAWPRGAIRALCAWSLGLACPPLHPLARADSGRSDALLASYVADEGCPDRTEFERRVRARLSAAMRTRSMRFEVRLASSADGTHGTLQVAGEPTSVRALSAASCAEAADALALVTALMLSDPAAAPAAKSAQQERAPRKGEPQTRNQALPAGSAAPVEAHDPNPTSTASDEASDDNAPDTPPPPQRATRTEPPAGPSSRPRVPFFRDWRIRAWAGGLLAWGVSPQLRAGPNVMASISARAHGAGPRYALAIGGRGASAHRMRIPEGTAKLRWIAFAGSLCVEGPERRFSVAGCALLESGWLEGSSRDGVTPRERTRFWGALGPTLALHALLHPRFGLRLGGELLALLVRDRFFLADRLLYSVPRLAFRAELSLYFTIW